MVPDFTINEDSGEQKITAGGNSSNFWIDHQSDGVSPTEESNGLLNNEHKPSSSPRVTNNNIKRNEGLLKKSSHKFVSAIKSLQCSPRVEGDYGKLEEKKKTNENNNENNNSSMLPQRVQEQQRDPQSVFIANFDEFQSKNDSSSPLIETGSVSKNLDLEKVLVRLDSIDTGNNSVTVHEALEIFTNGTDETNDTNDGNENENDRKSDVIQDLWNLSGLEQRQIDPTQVSSSAFPLSEWDEPKSPKQAPIQHEFSQYSNDSNDTPVTCNKSLILTPNNNNNERLCLRTDQAVTSSSDDFYAKPPKELFHRSLSLGDSLSPTEDDSPCSPDMTVGESSPGEASPKNKATNDSGYNTHRPNRPPQRKPDALKLPIMDTRRRRRTLTPESRSKDNNKNVLRRVEQFEKGFTASPATQQNPKSTRTLPSQERDSPVSSTVSSFVFSTDENGPESSRANRRMASPSFFWKTHPKTPEEKETRQQPPNVVSPEPILPAFFWKTHPRVTIKSYHFQQRRTIVRKVNPNLEGGRHHIAKVAVSWWSEDAHR